MNIVSSIRSGLAKLLFKGFNEDLKRYFSADNSDGSTYISKSNLYATQIWVYSAVNAIAINLSRVTMKIYKGQKEVTSGFEYEMINNPFGMSFNEMIEGLATWKHIRGGSYIVIYGEIGRPQGIELVSSDEITPIVDNGKLIAWKHTGVNNVTTIIPLENVMQFKFFNPFNHILGMNPIEATYNGIEADTWARDFDRALLKNGSVAGAVLETDNDISKEEAVRFRDIWNETHAGYNKAGKMAILYGGMKYKDVKLTAQDMNYIEQRKMNKAEILAAYKVPPVEVGDHSDSNYSNAEAQMKQFWTKKLLPELRSIEAVFNRVFFKYFAKGMYCKFDVSGITELQGDIEKTVNVAKGLFSMGVPFNEINDRLGLGFEDIEGGDIGYLPFGLVPAGSVADPVDVIPEDTAPEKILRIINGIKGITDESKKNSKVKDEKEDRKEKIWKKFDRDIIPVEREYRKKVEAFFFRLRKETLDNYTGKGMKAIKSYFDVKKAKDKISDISYPYFSQAIIVGADGVKEEINSEIVYNLEGPRVAEFLRTKKSKIKGLVDTVDSQVNQAVASGVEQGRTTAEIADMIRSVYTNADKRARTIAQTEIVGSANFGRMDLMAEAGIDKKEWINSFDDKVREAHQISEIVGINDEFSNGLRYPGDPEGSAENVINCRCSVGAVVGE